MIRKREKPLSKWKSVNTQAAPSATVAPTVSLYVNHYNTGALIAYERVGFRQVGTYATVLF